MEESTAGIFFHKRLKEALADILYLKLHGPLPLSN